MASDQSIDRDNAERGRAVDEDVVILIHDRAEHLSHDGLPLLELEHLYLRSDQVNV